MGVGSVSPLSKGRARSQGPVHAAHRSRADTAHKQPATVEFHPSATQPSSTAGVPSATSQRLSRVKSMPNKLNADQKTSTSATSSTHGRVPSTKRATKSVVPSQATTPTSSAAAKPMPAAPRTMTPRAVPKEPKAMKDVTANKPVTSHKVCGLVF